jgi:hypothetical protein
MGFIFHLFAEPIEPCCLVCQYWIKLTRQFVLHLFSLVWHWPFTDLLSHTLTRPVILYSCCYYELPFYKTQQNKTQHIRKISWHSENVLCKMCVYVHVWYLFGFRSRARVIFVVMGYCATYSTRVVELSVDSNASSDLGGYLTFLHLSISVMPLTCQ